MERRPDDRELLFDLSTVSNDVMSADTIVKKSILRIPRAVLRDSTIYFEEEHIVRYHEVKTNPELLLNIVGSCAIDGKVLGSSPAMPSLMLEVAEYDYVEPTRNRDKQWCVRSIAMCVLF